LVEESLEGARNRRGPSRGLNAEGAGVVADMDATQISHEMISRRAHEISQSDESGSDEENWLRAERELRGI
jgi:hypothetical protein